MQSNERGGGQRTSKKLYVGNISYRATEEDLIKKFGEVGECVSAQIVFDKFTGKSKGFAFVEMASKEQGQEAIRKINRTAMYGRGLIVDKAKPPRTNRSGKSGEHGF